MLEIKIGVLVLCAICKLIGELWWHNAQRFIMPILIIAPATSIISHTWWLGITCLPMIGALVMGYKTYGSSDGFDRGMWLFLITVTAWLGSAITGHLAWFIYLPICVASGIWGATTRQLLNIIIAPISGALIALPILFVHWIK